MKNLVRFSRESEIQIEAEAELEAGEVVLADLSKYQYLWKEEPAEWVVFKDDYDYTIFNIKTRMMLLIDKDDELMIINCDGSILGKVSAAHIDTSIRTVTLTSAVFLVNHHQHTEFRVG